MTHTDRVKELAEVMNTRMRDLVGGRMWMSAHMRRGDCEFSYLSQVYALTLILVVRYHWVMQEDFGDHLSRIKNHLDVGREILKNLSPASASNYAVPESMINPTYMQLPPPALGDKYAYFLSHLDTFF